MPLLQAGRWRSCPGSISVIQESQRHHRKWLRNHSGHVNLHPRKKRKVPRFAFYIHAISYWALGCCSSVLQPCLTQLLPNLMLVYLISGPLVAGEPGKRNVTGFGLCHIGRHTGRKLAWRLFPSRKLAWGTRPLYSSYR